MLVVAYVCANTQKQNQKKKYQILALVPSQEGLPWWLMGKESSCQCKRHGFDPWVKKIPWRGKWQPSPVFLPGKSHGQRSLAGYSPWSCKEQDMTEQLDHHHQDKTSEGMLSLHALPKRSRGHVVRWWLWASQEEGSPQNLTTLALDLRLLAPRTMKKINVCCLCHSVFGIALWQPTMTKTDTSPDFVLLAEQQSQQYCESEKQLHESEQKFERLEVCK